MEHPRARRGMSGKETDDILVIAGGPAALCEIGAVSCGRSLGLYRAGRL